MVRQAAVPYGHVCSLWSGAAVPYGQASSRSLWSCVFLMVRRSLWSGIPYGQVFPMVRQALVPYGHVCSLWSGAAVPYGHVCSLWSGVPYGQAFPMVMCARYGQVCEMLHDHREHLTIGNAEGVPYGQVFPMVMCSLWS